MVGERMVGCQNVALIICLVGLKEVRKNASLICYVFLLIILIGSSGDTIVSHFAVNYHNEAQRLGIDLNELYSALVKDGEVSPPDFDIEGRQVDLYK